MTELDKKALEICGIVESAALSDQRMIMAKVVAWIYYLDSEKNPSTAKALVDSQFTFYAKQFVGMIDRHFSRDEKPAPESKQQAPKPPPLTEKQSRIAQEMLNLLNRAELKKERSEILAWIVASNYLSSRNLNQEQAAKVITDRLLPLTLSMIPDADRYLDESRKHYIMALEGRDAVKN